MEIKPSLTLQIVKLKRTYQTKGMDFKKETGTGVHTAENKAYIPVPRTDRHVLGEMFLHSTFLTLFSWATNLKYIFYELAKYVPITWNSVLLYVAQRCYITITHSYDATGNSASKRTLGSIWGHLCTTSKEKAICH